VNSICRICGGIAPFAFTERVLGKYDVQYFHCRQCEFIQTEEPYWLQEAYRIPMSALDTGLVHRNLALMPRVALLLLLAGHRHDVCLDVGGGSGLFTRMMRDIGFDYYWQDEYSENFFARGFAAEDMDGHPAVLSLFEVIEHVAAPMEFLTKLVATHCPEMLIISTELHPGSTPPKDWHYYVFQFGQHISFFSEKTMKRVSEALGMHLAIAGPCQILTRTPLSSANARISMSRLAGFALPVVRKLMVSRVESDFAKLRDRL
jgi:hypothetical protein